MRFRAPAILTVLLAHAILPCSNVGLAQGPERASEPWEDQRLENRRNLRDKFHAWTPPSDLGAWKQESDRIRRQLLVSTGLWPMPELAQSTPTITGTVERDGYQVSGIIIRTAPGLILTGSLYQPTNRPKNERLPAVLSPHGHWSNGRFHDAGQKTATDQRKSGAETLESASRFHLQARMVHLARMGCVVFHYDMLGYADSTELDHRTGFSDVQSGLRLQNLMGLQTLNSIRALDFVASLPNVDPERIGVTGASGGGTQTFILCALDDRPAAAFPAVMVSTAMQGGCVCENAPYLRIGVNNVAFAALFAPKPMALSGADDWTIDIEKRGLPELKSVYALNNSADRVTAKCYPQFGHNYNAVSRRMMYAWFREHLKLDEQSVEEREFKPLSVREMTVFNENTNELRVESAAALNAVKEWWTADSVAPFNRLKARAESAPEDARKEYREIVGGAAEVMLGGARPSPDQIRVWGRRQQEGDRVRELNGVAGRVGAKDAVRFAVSIPAQFNGNVVINLDGTPGDNESKLASSLRAGRFAVMTAELFLSSQSTAGVDEGFYGYTHGYNRPVLAERVQDVLTLAVLARQNPAVKGVHLIGTGRNAVIGLLAAAVAGEAVDSVAADLNGFEFEDVESVTSTEFLPGATKYGGVAGLAALAAPTRCRISRLTGGGGFAWALPLMHGGGSQSLELSQSAATEAAILEWLNSAKVDSAVR